MSQIRVIEDGDQNWGMEPKKDSMIETRMIGAEDIYWDADGVDDIDSFTDRTGTERKITALNSGKIPLQASVRSQLPGMTTVTEALLKLAERTGSTSSYSILEEDLTVVLSADLTHSQKQDLIDEQIRNLGGHVLTFQFPESLDLTVSFNFMFTDFHNGKLVIDLNGIELSDAVELANLILVRDCVCHVEIAGGNLKHTHSAYAIRAVRCPQLYLKELGFTGTGLDTSYALFMEDSDGFAEDCVFSSDHEVKASGFLASVPVADHNAASTAHSGLFAGKANASHTHEPSECGADASGTAASAVAAHDGDSTAHSDLFAGKADASHTHVPSECGADASGTAASAVAAHDGDSTPHSGVLAPLDSPAFTGTPTAPTPAGTSNDTTVATTAFVQTVGSAAAGQAGTALTSHNTAANPHSGVLTPLSDYQNHVSNTVAHRALVPAGVVFPFAGAGSVPTGFLLCNGQAVSRTTYADLFAVIGTLYGVGDGSTTFNVPDFRGKFLRGYLDQNSAAIGMLQAEGLPDICFDAGSSGEVSWANTGYPMTKSAADEKDAQQQSLGFTRRVPRASQSNPIYGNSEHVTPENYAVQWIIKY